MIKDDIKISKGNEKMIEAINYYFDVKRRAELEKRKMKIISFIKNLEYGL